VESPNAAKQSKASDQAAALACQGHSPVVGRGTGTFVKAREEKGIPGERNKISWATSQKQKIWATQEKLITCDMEGKILRAEGRRGKILEDPNISPKSMQQSVIVQVFWAVLELYCDVTEQAHVWTCLLP